MAALHNSLKTLGPIEFEEQFTNDLKPFLCDAFSNGQLLVDSVPIPVPSATSESPDSRSRASSGASSASEILPSSARTSPPPADVEALQKEWKQVKLNPRDNPLGMSVYKLGSKDGKGAWFARRSVHEGLGFAKWKRGLEREFPETMKVQGGPGVGNIRGIGGERRVAYKNVEGVGKMEVYLLSAQFPGPTTPRDFVTMFLTSDQALSDQSGGQQEVPRHFMVVSKPCNHPDAPPRDGYIRGQYESVEFIREIPINGSKRRHKKSASTTNLMSSGRTNRNRSGSSLAKEVTLRNAKLNGQSPSNSGSPQPAPTETPTAASEVDLSDEARSNSDGRARGKTISFDRSRGADAKGENMDVPREDEEDEMNPVEWIMITRSDPGGSVPRFMIERGTPGAIVADAGKFLDWACAKDIEEFMSDDETLAGFDGENEAHHDHHNEKDLHNYQTNGHLAGIEDDASSTHRAALADVTANGTEGKVLMEPEDHPATNGGGLYGMAAGVAAAAGSYIASHTPTMITDHLPGPVSVPEEHTNSTPATAKFHRASTSSISTVSSVGSFASALENTSEPDSHLNADSTSLQTIDSGKLGAIQTQQDKELRKLEYKKRKINEKLARQREKEVNKKSEGSAKEEETLKKAEERHEREVKKQEEKYRREVEKLEQKKKKEARKVEEKRKKQLDQDEKTKLKRDLDEAKAELSLLRKEKEILRGQVGDLQAENTALAAKIGRLGAAGEDVLKDIRAEVVRGGRLRTSSLKGMTRSPSFRSQVSAPGGVQVEKSKENLPPKS